MASTRPTSASMKLVGSKKSSFREAILRLALEWKDLDEQLDTTSECFHECLSELETRENNLESLRESVMQSNEELDSIRKSIELRAEELESKEEILKLFRQAQIEEIKLKEKQLDKLRSSADERIKEAELREERLSEQQKSMEGLLEKLEVEKKQFEIIQLSVDEKIQEIRLSEKYVEDRSKVLDSIQNGLEGRAKELGTKEELSKAHELEVLKFNEESCRQLELKEREIVSAQKLNDERAEKLDLKETQLNTVQDYVNQCFKEYHSKDEQLKSEKKLLEERCKEHELEEKDLEYAKKLNEEWALKLYSRKKQLDSVHIFVGKCFKEFRSNNKQLKLDKKFVQGRTKEIETKEKQLGKRSEDVKLKEKKLGKQTKEIELKEKQHEERSQEIKMREQQLELRCQEIKLREEQLEQQYKEIELRDKQYGKLFGPQVKVEKVEDMTADYANDPVMGSSADIPFAVDMDGRSLQLFLNERFRDHESLSDEVCRALGFSSNPAKLVLDAMEGFYPPHLKKGDVEFEEGVVRRSCILLLEQLMRISPQILPHVKEEALRLAGEWKVKMRVEPSNSLEVLGLMQLLASYKLASYVDADELLKLLEAVAERKQAPELCRLLGFTERVPDFVRCLIERHKHMEAITFIYAFDLINKYPPIPLLNDHLSYAEEAAKKICEGHYSLEAQGLGAKKEIAALEALINCIQLHRLESEYSSENIKARIEQLIKLTESASFEPSPASVAQPQEEMDLGNDTPTNASKSQTQELDGRKRTAPVLDHACNTPFEPHQAKKICWIAIPAEAAPSGPAVTACPAQSAQLPTQHGPGILAAPYPRPHSANRSLWGTALVPQHMSHLTSQHGFGTSANWGFQPFDSAGNQFVSSPNFYAMPSTVAGKPYISHGQKKL